MDLTAGRPDVSVGLIDGPVDVAHPDLSEKNFHFLNGSDPTQCRHKSILSCDHGTQVAGILAARRGTAAPAICPDCTLLVRPIFTENSHFSRDIPSTTFKELARAIVDCTKAGAKIVNISAAPVAPSLSRSEELAEALDYAANRSVLVFAAAGNQATLGTSAITRHQWVTPVGACDSVGNPLGLSNFGGSIGRNGLLAPGYAVTSLAAGGKYTTIEGTSASAPFVTGAAALLMSLFPTATPEQVRAALSLADQKSRRRVVPPLLNALAAFELLRVNYKQVG